MLEETRLVHLSAAYLKGYVDALKGTKNDIGKSFNSYYWDGFQRGQIELKFVHNKE